MDKTSNFLNVYLVNIDSNFADRICRQYKLSTSSRAKLLKRISSVARKQFLVSRALVSHILTTNWSSLKLDPNMDDSSIPPSLFSNELFLSLSHSSKYVVAALSKNQVAVDVEYLSRNRNYLEIAKRAFHLNEVKILECSNSQRAIEESFYKSWTLRECCYKLGLLRNLTNQEFDTERKIREENLTPFSYIKDNVFLSVISNKAAKINLIRID